MHARRCDTAGAVEHALEPHRHLHEVTPDPPEHEQAPGHVARRLRIGAGDHVSHGGAQVSALESEPGHRGKLIGRAEVIRLRARHLGVDRGVSIPHGVLLAGRCQQLDAELAHAHQERERGLAVDIGLVDEGGVHERLERVERVEVPFAPAPERLDRIEREPRREHRELGEEAAGGIVQQPGRPLDRRSERALPLRQVARRVHEQRELPIEAAQDVGRRQHPRARRGELDREGDSVEDLADPDDSGQVLVGQLEEGIGGGRALDEEFDGGRRARPCQRIGRRGVVGRERIDVVHPFPAHTEHNATRGQECGIRRDRVQLDQNRRGADDLLEVVEDEQHPALVQCEREPLFQLQAGGLADAERIADRRQQQLGLQHVLERHEDDAVREERRSRLGGGDREPALADPPRPGERHEPGAMLAEQFDDVRDRRVAADDACERRRHVRFVRISGCRARRLRARLVEALGEQGREVRGDPLPEVDGGVEGEVGGAVIGPDAFDQRAETVVRPFLSTCRGLGRRVGRARAAGRRRRALEHRRLDPRSRPRHPARGAAAPAAAAAAVVRRARGARPRPPVRDRPRLVLGVRERRARRRPGARARLRRVRAPHLGAVRTT